MGLQHIAMRYEMISDREESTNNRRSDKELRWGPGWEEEMRAKIERITLEDKAEQTRLLEEEEEKIRKKQQLLLNISGSRKYV